MCCEPQPWCILANLLCTTIYSVELYPRDIATITVTGPSNVWFGAGFNASAMKEGPWAVVVDGGSDGKVSEHKLADQGIGISCLD